jgi:Zn finger protein HypA/HybF involved in hydrogenase expression
MHERATVRDLVRKVNEVALERGLVRVTRVGLRIGALSHVTVAAVRQLWPELAAGTPAEGAAIDGERSDALDDSRALGVVLTAIDGSSP